MANGTNRKTRAKVARKKTAKKAPSITTATRKKQRMGRPPDINEALVETVCRRLADGESLRQICKAPDLPDRTTIRRWLFKGDCVDARAEYKEFRLQYARAREDQADALADEVLDVARAATAETAHADRVRIDAIKWIAGKLRPSVYGEKLAHEHAGKGGGPIESRNLTITNDMSVEEAARIYHEMLNATQL